MHLPQQNIHNVISTGYAILRYKNDKHMHTDYIQHRPHPVICLIYKI